MNDIKIEKLSGGLGRRNPSGDMISGLVLGGVSVSGGLQVNQGYRLASIKDLVALKVDADYDQNNAVLVYEHVKEFFRVNPNGDLYLMVVSRQTTPKILLTDTTGAVSQLIKFAGGTIKQIGVGYHPTTKVTNITAVDAGIVEAQLLSAAQFKVHAPVEIILEGTGFDITKTVNFRAKNKANVSVMVGQSYAVANRTVAGAKPYEKYAAIGTALGALSKASVNECIGWVAKFNVKGGELDVPSIGGVRYEQISDGMKNTLNDEGAVFFVKHIGSDGVFFNDSHTCTALTSDFAYIENNRTIHKATRAIRAILLPYLNSPVLIDAETGKLAPGTIKTFENEGRRALEVMESDGEVSAFDVNVDPGQNILSTSELKVDFELTPTGTARTIAVTIGFVNPF